MQPAVLCSGHGGSAAQRGAQRARPGPPQHHRSRPRSSSRRCRLAATCSCASGARMLPCVTCRTVVKLATPEDLQLVLMGNDLVAEVFYSASDNPVVDAISFNSYRVRSAAQTLGLHMGGARTHATVVALAAHGGIGCEGGGGGGQQQQQQQPWRAREDPQKAIGVVNVTCMQASPSIATAAGCRPGTPFAFITNMAVSPEARRRGVAHQLMRAAVRASLADLDVRPPFALLLAYKYYEPAMRLYESWGFTSTPWVDPAWQEDAEKGRAARQRRIMMVKQLAGAGLAAGLQAAGGGWEPEYGDTHA